MSTVITGSDVEAAVAAGHRSIPVPQGAVVTPQARDRARELAVTFEARPAPVPVAPSDLHAAPRLSRPAAGSPLGGSGITPETEGYSLPIHAPLYFRRMGQKVVWHKAIQIKFRADPAAIKEFLPEPFALATDLITVGVTEHQQPGHGLPVRGAYVDALVSFNGLEGRHSILTIADSDEALCPSREELGRAAILGDVRLWAAGNTWWGAAGRGGKPILRISLFPEGVVAPESDAVWRTAAPLLEYKKIPSADPTRKPWRQILAIYSERQGPVIEQSVGRASVEFVPSAWGLHRLTPLEVLGGTFWHFEGGELKNLQCLWEDRPDPIP